MKVEEKNGIRNPLKFNAIHNNFNTFFPSNENKWNMLQNLKKLFWIFFMKD